ncbi:MAG: hypothetical protein K6L80_16400 [Agarilytica sp.]
MKKVFIYIFVVIVLGGCTYAAIPIKNETLAKIDKVGIVSIIGNEFTYGYMGVTVFNNKVTLEEQELIDFDEKVEEILKTSIKTKLVNNPNPITVVDLNFDKEELIGSYKVDGKYKSFDINLIANKLTVLANQHGLKYLIVVTRGYNALANGAGSTGGIGISKTVHMPKDEVILHNYLDYKLFEVETQATPSFFSTSAMNFGQKREVQFPWKQPLSEYSDNEIDQLISLIIEDLEYRVPWSVNYMLGWRKNS